MLGAGAPEPEGACFGLDVWGESVQHAFVKKGIRLTETTPAKDGDLRVCRLVNVVVGSPAVKSCQPLILPLFTQPQPQNLPQPHILHIQPPRPLGNMHRHKRNHTPRLDRPIPRRLQALRHLLLRPRIPPNPHMHIPHPARRSRITHQIPLHAHRTRLLPLRTNNKITQLHLPGLAGDTANLHHRLRVVHVVEERAGRQNHGVGLAHDLRPGWHLQRARHAVQSVVEEEDLPLRGGGVDGGLERGRVVGGGVAAGAEGARGEEGGGREGLVLGFRAGEVMAGGGEEGGRAGVGGYGTGGLDGAGRGVEVAVGPGGDGGCAAGEEGARGTFDGDGGVGQGDVFEDEGAGGGGAGGGRPGCEDRDGDVGEAAVEDGDGAGVDLGGAAGGDVDADLAVVDGQAVVGPAPVPELDDGWEALVCVSRRVGSLTYQSCSC